MTRVVAWIGWALLLGCADKPPAPAPAKGPSAAAPPLQALVTSSDGGEDREDLFRVAPFEVFGEQVPEGAQRVRVEASGVRLGGGAPIDLERPGEKERLGSMLGPEPKVVIEAAPEVFLAQAASLLAVLDDAGTQVYLMHPSGRVAFRLVLRDEPAFRVWLDEPKPGRLRIIQRADGFEVQTSVGKLPGADPNGPTVPLRGGQQNVAALRDALARLKTRFDDTPDLCFVPSFGTDLVDVAAAMTANYHAPEEPFFDQLCLVYPRP